MNLSDLKKLDVNSLTDLAQTMGVTDIERKPRKDLIFSILKVHARNGEDIFGDGVLEILPDGYGFLGALTASTSQDLTTSTCLLPRSESSTCRPATPSRARSVPRRASPSAISPS